MTVAELIAELQRLDPGLHVRAPSQWGHLDAVAVEVLTTTTVPFKPGQLMRPAETWVNIVLAPVVV